MESRAAGNQLEVFYQEALSNWEQEKKCVVNA